MLRGARHTMSFGKNPHVAKAQAAEQKAQQAKDEAARTLAWREAGRLWERAADRENSDARRKEYADRAQAARDEADGCAAESDSSDSHDSAAAAVGVGSGLDREVSNAPEPEPAPSASQSRRLLN
jgi:hypothetical protein